MAIELRNISKKFGDFEALQNINLSIEDGAFITLLGPSGCGKTTLLRIVGGFTQPDTGEVFIDGKPVNHLPPNQRPTGMVFQSYALFPHMTVEKNISFGLRMRGASKAEIAEKIARSAKLVGIESMLKRFPSQLSGGQQQRVAVARTLAVEPAALLLDEPLAALDRRLRVDMRTELRKLILQVGITTIFVTHDQEEALTMSDRIAVMDHGRIVQYGTPMEVYDKPKSTFVASFVGNSNLFAGKIQAADGKWYFESDQVRLQVPPEFANQTGQQVNLLVRPEHLKLLPLEQIDTQVELGAAGEVTFVTLLGLSIEYEVRLDAGAQIKLEMPRSRDQAPLPQGTRVWVSPKDAASFLTIPVT